MRETWKCIVCAKEFNWASCRDVKPSTKSYGKKFSRKQPIVNLSLTKRMRKEGFSLTKMKNVLSQMGFNCRNYRDMIIQDKRMREVIKSCFNVIIHQNRKENRIKMRYYLCGEVWNTTQYSCWYSIY